MSAWLLPDHIADVLPVRAGQVEQLRRILLDRAKSYGYAFVIPPAIEYTDALLVSDDPHVDAQTFKLVDQISGRTLGLRADMTPQAARIDAHLLGHQGITRLCYCGHVYHTQPEAPFTTRDPLHFGAELYGHEGAETDGEVMTLALDCLHAVGMHDVLLDIGDAGLVRSLVDAAQLPAEAIPEVFTALQHKDLAQLRCTLKKAGQSTPAALLQLLAEHVGEVQVLDVLEPHFNPHPHWHVRLARARALVAHIHNLYPQLEVLVDFTEQQGWSYYTGLCFAVYSRKENRVLLRGGRYDSVGAAFGQHHAHEVQARSAVGFGLDIKTLAWALPKPETTPAIRAHWREHAGFHNTVAQLRRSGKTVVCTFAQHSTALEGICFTHELVWQEEQWQVLALNTDAIQI